jgi:hypothetical protein
MRVLVVGNCQAHGFAACLRNILPRATVSVSPISSSDVGELSKFDRIFLQNPWKGSTDHAQTRHMIIAQAGERLILWPPFLHYGFHPDLVYATCRDELVSSPLSHYNSALCIFGWTHGLSEGQTAALFCDAVFDFLGYYSYGEAANRELVAEWTKCGVDARALLCSWEGCFTYSINHPKLFVLRDLAKAVCQKHHLSTCDAGEELKDDLLSGPVWPIYPEIGSRLGITGGYNFKPSAEKGKLAPILKLEEFIERSYYTYSALPASINIDRLARPGDALDRLGVFLFGRNACSVREPDSHVADYARELVCEEEFLDRGADL